MKRDAEMFAAEDAKHKEEVETRNNADAMAYNAEKTLRDLGDKVPADLKSEIDSKISLLRTSLQGQDVNAIKQATQELSTVMQQLGTRVYQQAGAPGGEHGGTGGGPTDGPGSSQEQGKPKEPGTVEGEFREV